MAESDDPFKAFRDLGMLSALGIMFVASTFIGLAIGFYLDRWLGTGPWLTLLFLVFGIVSAFVSLYREMKKLIKREEAEQNDGPGSAPEDRT